MACSQKLFLKPFFHCCEGVNVLHQLVCYCDASKNAVICVFSFLWSKSVPVAEMAPKRALGYLQTKFGLILLRKVNFPKK